MRSGVLFLAVSTLLACDPKGDGGGATASAGTSTAGDATTSGDTTSANPTTTGVTTASITTSSSSSTTDTTTGDVPEDACVCRGAYCELSLCDSFTMACEGPCTQDGWWGFDEQDEVDLQCALIALRDRAPGRLDWETVPCADAPCRIYTTFRIRSDGTLNRYESSENLFCTTYGPETHGTLKDPSYFSGCLAQPDVMARFLCLNDAFLEGQEECAPGVCE